MYSESGGASNGLAGQLPSHISKISEDMFYSVELKLLICPYWINYFINLIMIFFKKISSVYNF